MENIVLDIKMFGGFKLLYNKKAINLEYNKNTKSTQLLQYFLYNKNKKISRDELINILYSHDNIINPVNNLKVTLFRLRKILSNSEIPIDEFIIFKNGYYCWNNNINTKIDSHIFKELIEKSEEKYHDINYKEAILEKALNIYEGEFLPMISTEEWVIIENQKFARMYVKCLKTLSSILFDKEKYLKCSQYCDKAIKIYPFDEDIRIIKLECLFKMKLYKDAAADFNNMTKFFIDELGVPPSEHISRIYKKMLSHACDSSVFISDIKNILDEKETFGAYYCNYMSFIDSYHIMARIVERWAQPLFLIEYSLEETKSIVHSSQHDIKKAAEYLHKTIKNSIRRGDIYTQFNRNRFLILLIGVTYDDCIVVSQRISSKFNYKYRSKNIHIKSNIILAKDFSFEDSSNLVMSKK